MATKDDILEVAWSEELERRAQELLSGKVKGIPVEEVRRDIDALLTRIRSERTRVAHKLT